MLAKCEYFELERKFLGHIVSADGMRPDPERQRLSEAGLRLSVYMKYVHSWAWPLLS